MELITKYFPDLTAQQQNQFAQLGDLYTEWNAKINVISRKDIDNLYLHHVLHSLAIAKISGFKAGTRFLDVGTGGGFPGIPLAILFPECKFHLIDALAKKITVVNEVSKAIGLTNVVGEHIKVEKLKTQYDFIISRAVTQFDKFWKISHKRIMPTDRNILENGILYLKGGDFEDELKDIEEKVTLYPISHHFEEPFFETKKVIHYRKA